MAIELIRRLAVQTMAYSYKVWGYGESIGLQGLLAASETLGDDAYAAFVHGLVDAWAATRPEMTYADHVAPGRALLDVYERTADNRLLEQAHRLAKHFAGLPRTQAGVTLHRPDHPEFAQYVYVDCIYTDAPFLCRLGQVTGERRHYEQATEMLLGHMAVLRDAATGLFYHLYDAGHAHTNGAFWGRGNGWAMLGLVDTLEALPPDTPARGALQKCLDQQAVTLAELQDSSGHWHTVLNRPETYLETSLAAFFCAAFTRGVQLGLLPDNYLVPAEAAWSALNGSIDERGVVSGVSQATPPGDAAHYQQVRTGGLYPWGQGPALLAAVARMRR